MDLLRPPVTEGTLRPLAGCQGDKRNSLICDDGICNFDMTEVGKKRGHAHEETFYLYFTFQLLKPLPSPRFIENGAEPVDCGEVSYVALIFGHTAELAALPRPIPALSRSGLRIVDARHSSASTGAK